MTQHERDTKSPDPWELCYRQLENLRHEEVAGELLLLDENNEQVHQLNAAASFVWLQCDGTCSVREIVERITEQYDVERDVARCDVLTVIGRMCELGLLEIVCSE